jgi:uncharacterized membrane protein
MRHSFATIERQTSGAVKTEDRREVMERTRVPLDHRRALILGAFATVHFVLWVALFAIWTADTMARFDGRRDSGLGTSLLNGAYETLSFPLVTGLQLVNVTGLGFWGWLVIVGNSLAWGWVAWRAIRLRRMRRAASN